MRTIIQKDIATAPQIQDAEPTRDIPVKHKTPATIIAVVAQENADAEQFPEPKNLHYEKLLVIK